MCSTRYFPYDMSFLRKVWEDKRYYSNTSPQPLHPGNFLAGWSKAAAASVPRQPWSSGLSSLTVEARTEQDLIYPTSAHGWVLLITVLSSLHEDSSDSFLFLGLATWAKACQYFKTAIRIPGFHRTYKLTVKGYQDPLARVIRSGYKNSYDIPGTLCGRRQDVSSL